MEHENQPIRVTIHSDHLTVHCETLPKDESLKNSFRESVRCANLRPEVLDTINSGKVTMLFGTQENMYRFMYLVTQDFDLLIV